MHVLGHHTVVHLHPQLAGPGGRGAAHLDEEIVLRVAAAADVHEQQVDAGHVRVELDQVHRLVGQAEAVDPGQVLALAQASRFDIDLPDLLENVAGPEATVALLLQLVVLGQAGLLVLVDELAEGLVPGVLLLLAVGHHGEVLILGVQGQ